MTSIMWFRQDLRIADNPALAAAAKRSSVLPVYILDETDPKPPGGANRWWLHHSLKALEKSLGAMVYLRGDPAGQLERLAAATGADCVYWNRCYEPHAVARDSTVKRRLRGKGLTVESFNAGLLFEPWELTTGSGGPYKVFSPFWRAAMARAPVKPSAPAKADCLVPEGLGDELDDLKLLPAGPDWAKGWDDIWSPGEQGARKRFEAFCDQHLAGYGTKRDRPDLGHTSLLSPHLHFGEISPRQIFAQIRWLMDEQPELERDGQKFLSELGWREFCHHLLFHFPELPTQNWKRQFDDYPWRDSAADLTSWQQGRTGYPLVDAGMRELWRTGYMHNRVRMVAASFLTKHLRIHWKHGEAWFRDTLVDADLANNSAGWQWVTGSGADAAPYFRIFNPTMQARKFDPDGSYIRRWCPELAGLSNKEIHAPFEAPETTLKNAGVILDKTYPAPIVDHAKARQAALAGYEKIKR